MSEDERVMVTYAVLVALFGEDSENAAAYFQHNILRGIPRDEIVAICNQYRVVKGVK